MSKKNSSNERRERIESQSDLFDAFATLSVNPALPGSDATSLHHDQILEKTIIVSPEALLLDRTSSWSNYTSTISSGKKSREMQSGSERWDELTGSGNGGQKQDLDNSCGEKKQVSQGYEDLDDEHVDSPHGKKVMFDPTADCAEDLASNQNAKKAPRRKLIYEDNSIYDVGIDSSGHHEIPRCVYFRMVNDGKLGDQQRLRDLWRLSELEGKNIAGLPLDEKSVEKLIEKYGLADNPGRRARQILICFERLRTANPKLLVCSFNPIIDTNIHLLSETEMPTALKANIAVWIEMKPVINDGSRNEIDALAADTIVSYARNVNTIAAALKISGVRLDPLVDVAFLLQPVACSRWLKVLKSSMERSTVRGLLAALLRVAHDLPGQSACHIKTLEARLSEIMDDLALDAEEMAMLARWVEPEKHQCLLSAPDDLMRQAEDCTALPSGRLLSSAAAFALRIMWEHPALSEAAIANFDFRKHIVGDRGCRKVLRFREARARQAAAWVPEPFSAEAENLLDRLIAVRKAMSVTTTLLLPGIDGRPRSVRSAMEVIYNKIQGVLSERFTSSRLRDLNTFIALEDKDADLAEIADGAGYKEARSLGRRFGQHATRREVR